MEDTTDTVLKELMAEVTRVYKSHSTLTDEVLSALQFVFQGPLLQALDLVDHKGVSQLVSPSGRTVYQVIGSSGTPYVCLRTSRYCGCPAYKFSVIKRQEHFMCKHLLAIELTVAMETCAKIEVSNEELARAIKNID